MPDTKFKPTSPGRQFPNGVSSRALSHPSSFTRPPVTIAARGQDSTAAGYRVLLQFGTGGAAEFQVTNDPPTALNAPDFTSWRTVSEARQAMTDGTAIEARIIWTPTGAKIKVNAFSPDEIARGGEARMLVTWTNEADETATITVGFGGMTPSDQPDGAEQAAQGAAWAQLAHDHTSPVIPPGLANNPEIAARWSRGVTVDLKLQLRGAPRVVNLTVSEVPYQHTIKHDQLESSFTGQPADLATPVKRPQTEAKDGPTYQEHRFGISAALRAAQRQTERLGPMVWQWGAFTSGDTSVLDLDTQPRVITTSGTTRGHTPPMERLVSGTNTTWARDSPGFAVISTGQQPARRREAGTSAATYATQPVRLWVLARFAAPGAGVGLVRVQTTEGSYVQLRPNQAVIGSTWTWATITGSVEASIASDDGIAGAPYAVGQVFASRGDAPDNLEIKAVILNYGHTLAPASLVTAGAIANPP